MQQSTFRPGQNDYSALQQDHADLIAPDIVAGIRGDFQQNALEVGGETLANQESELNRAREGDGKGGDAQGVLASKPTPGDEFAAVAYGRAPDERTDNTLMLAVGIGAAMSREGGQHEQDAPQPTAAPAKPENEPEAPGRGNYGALCQETAQAAIQQNDHADLVAPDIKADAQSYAAQMTQQQEQNADLTAPDIRADVASQTMQRQRQQGYSLGM